MSTTTKKEKCYAKSRFRKFIREQEFRIPFIKPFIGSAPCGRAFIRKACRERFFEKKL